MRRKCTGKLDGAVQRNTHRRQETGEQAEEKFTESGLAAAIFATARSGGTSGRLQCKR